jgi:hypothetical protein
MRVDRGNTMTARANSKKPADIDVKQLIEILPKLIRENDTVKGAILTALSGVVATREDIKDMIREMDKRFADMQNQSDKRFSEVDKHFSDVDKHFSDVDKHFSDVDKHFSDVDKRFDRVEREIKIVGVSVDRLEGKQGVQLEKTILDLMRETLKMENVDPDKIKKVFIVDRKGMVFWNDYSSDIDVLVENGNVYAIEVKAKASHADVTRFVQNIKLYELVENKKVTKSFVISLRIEPDIKAYAESRGLIVIAGDISS